MKNKISSDKTAGLVLVLIGVLVAIVTSSLKITMKLSPGDPGPRLFPYIAGIGLIICGAGVLFSKEHDKKMLILNKDQWLKFLFLLVVLACYQICLKIFGFLVSTPIMSCILVYILKKQDKVKKLSVVLFSVILTCVIYIAFVKLLSIILPVGLIFGGE